LDPGGEKLAPRSYSARRQGDGSWLLQFSAATLARGAVRLQAEGAVGAAEPLGCFSAQPAP